MKIPDITIAVDGYSSTGKSSFARLMSTFLPPAIPAFRHSEYFKVKTIHSVSSIMVPRGCPIFKNLCADS